MVQCSREKEVTRMENEWSNVKVKQAQDGARISPWRDGYYWFSMADGAAIGPFKTLDCAFRDMGVYYHPAALSAEHCPHAESDLSAVGWMDPRDAVSDPDRHLPRVDAG